MLTTERLAAAMTQAVEDATTREKAADLGRQIRAEGGVSAAVAVIDAWLS